MKPAGICTMHLHLFIGTLFFSCTSEKARFVDEDQDGFTKEDGDCDDNNATIHPHAEELCDGLDNNCDQEIDEDSLLSTVWYQDADGDGFGSMEAIYSCQQPNGFTTQTGDCDDNNAHIHPYAEESLLNIGTDNRCDGIDELEEYEIHNQEQLPASIEQVFIHNFLYAGPTLFLLREDSIHRLSYDLEEIIYEQEYTSAPWINIHQNRDSELWYTQQNTDISFTARNYLTEQRITSLEPISNIDSFDHFMGDGMQYNAVSLQEANIILYYQRGVMEIGLESMSFVQALDSPPLSFEEVLDINDDGYGELWITMADQGRLLYGSSTPQETFFWTLYYDEAETCRQTKVIAWEDDTNIICQNGHVITNPIGPPDTVSSLEQGTRIFEEPAASMDAVDHHIVVQDQNLHTIHILSSEETNPTVVHTNQGKSDLYLSAKSEPQIFLLSILEQNGFTLSYETIGLTNESD